VPARAAKPMPTGASPVTCPGDVVAMETFAAVPLLGAARTRAAFSRLFNVSSLIRTIGKPSSLSLEGRMPFTTAWMDLSSSMAATAFPARTAMAVASQTETDETRAHV